MDIKKFKKYVNTLPLDELATVNRALHTISIHPELWESISQMSNNDVTRANIHCSELGKSKSDINETLNGIILQVGQTVGIYTRDMADEEFEIVKIENDTISLTDKNGGNLEAHISLIRTL